MFHPENDPNQDLAQNQSRDNSAPNLDNIDTNVSAESVAVRKKQLEGIFTKLIIFGLTLGTILGITAYYLLKRLGMTEKPKQLEQERIERDRQPDSTTDVEKINNFHIPKSDRQRFEI